jgi:hypothetical protein
MNETIDLTKPTDRRPALTGVVISPTALSDLFFNAEHENYGNWCANCRHDGATGDVDAMFAAILADAKDFVAKYLDLTGDVDTFAHNLASDFWHRL